MMKIKYPIEVVHGLAKAVIEYEGAPILIVPSDENYTKNFENDGKEAYKIAIKVRNELELNE